MKKKAFTLIELLVVIAIIAILAAILFPVLSQARTAAKVTKSLVQMKQIGTGLVLYLGDSDDMMLPSAIRLPGGADPIIWTEGLFPYVKSKDIFIAEDAQGAGYPANWATRNLGSIGMSEATGVDQTATGCTEGQASTVGYEGFVNPSNFSQAEFSSKTPLLAQTPVGLLANKYRGYVFSPYNGPSNITEPQLGLPLIGDTDLVKELGGAPTSLSPGQMKPVYARYGRDGKGNGRGPIVLADTSAKVLSANRMKAGGYYWRFR